MQYDQAVPLGLEHRLRSWALISAAPPDPRQSMHRLPNCLGALPAEAESNERQIYDSSVTELLSIFNEPETTQEVEGAPPSPVQHDTTDDGSDGAERKQPDHGVCEGMASRPAGGMKVQREGAPDDLRVTAPIGKEGRRPRDRNLAVQKSTRKRAILRELSKQLDAERKLACELRAEEKLLKAENTALRDAVQRQFAPSRRLVFGQLRQQETQNGLQYSRGALTQSRR